MPELEHYIAAGVGFVLGTSLLAVTLRAFALDGFNRLLKTTSAKTILGALQDGTLTETEVRKVVSSFAGRMPDDA